MFHFERPMGNTVSLLFRYQARSFYNSTLKLNYMEVRIGSKFKILMAWTLILMAWTLIVIPIDKRSSVLT